MYSKSKPPTTVGTSPIDTATMSNEKTVYFTPRRTCYHTNPDCAHLDRARTVLEKQRQDMLIDLPVCRECSGETKPSRDSDSNALRRKLEEMDADEI